MIGELDSQTSSAYTREKSLIALLNFDNSNRAHLFDKLWHCEGSSVDVSVVVLKLKLLHFCLCQCSHWLTQYQLLNNAVTVTYMTHAVYILSDLYIYHTTEAK